MKKTTQLLTPAKLLCDVFGHKYEMTKEVTYHVKEYTCKCCKKELTTDSNGRLTELTPKFKDINQVLERIYTNKLLRLKQQRFSAA